MAEDRRDRLDDDIEAGMQRQVMAAYAQIETWYHRWDLYLDQARRSFGAATQAIPWSATRLELRVDPARFQHAIEDTAARATWLANPDNSIQASQARQDALREAGRTALVGDDLQAERAEWRALVAEFSDDQEEIAQMRTPGPAQHRATPEPDPTEAEQRDYEERPYARLEEQAHGLAPRWQASHARRARERHQREQERQQGQARGFGR